MVNSGLLTPTYVGNALVRILLPVHSHTRGKAPVKHYRFSRPNQGAVWITDSLIWPIIHEARSWCSSSTLWPGSNSTLESKSMSARQIPLHSKISWRGDSSDDFSNCQLDPSCQSRSSSRTYPFTTRSRNSPISAKAARMFLRFVIEWPSSSKMVRPTSIPRAFSASAICSDS